MKTKKLKLIGVEEETKKKLDNLKLYSRETYDDIIVRLMNLSKEEVK